LRASSVSLDPGNLSDLRQAHNRDPSKLRAEAVEPAPDADGCDRKIMVHFFACVLAVMNMNRKDYYQNGKRWWIRLHEKGGKFHEVPVHHTAEEYLDAYIEVAGLAEEKNLPLFRTTRGKTRTLTANGMNRIEAWKMIKRRSTKAKISAEITCHTFRATGITAYLGNGGTIEHAQQIAAHESPRTTKLYDRGNDAISLDEIERIVI